MGCSFVGNRFKRKPSEKQQRVWAEIVPHMMAQKFVQTFSVLSFCLFLFLSMFFFLLLSLFASQLRGHCGVVKHPRNDRFVGVIGSPFCACHRHQSYSRWTHSLEETHSNCRYRLCQMPSGGSERRVHTSRAHWCPSP